MIFIKAELIDLPLFMDWMNKKGTLNSHSIRNYYSAIECFLAKNPDIDSLEHYNSFLVEHTIKKRSTLMPHAIRAFIRFKFAMNRDTMDYLLDGLIPIRRQLDYVTEKRYLEPKQLFDVINNMDEERHKVLAIVQMITGVRAGDIIKLRKGNIMVENYEGKLVVKLAIVGKGNKRNVVYIHDSTVQQILLDYISLNIEDDGYYFMRTSTSIRKK